MGAVPFQEANWALVRNRVTSPTSPRTRAADAGGADRAETVEVHQASQPCPPGGRRGRRFRRTGASPRRFGSVASSLTGQASGVEEAPVTWPVRAR